MKGEELDITVGIMSYNRKHFLKESLMSVLAQTRKPRNIIIYDNGSKQEVYDEISSLLSKNVKWVGADGSNNNIWNFSRAVKDVDTEYVMVLHDDDRLMSDFLEKQFDIIHRFPDFLAYSGNGILINDEGKRLKDLVINQKADFFFFYDQSSVIKHSLSSCIPLSPIIYKSTVFSEVSLNPFYGKCCDSALYLDIVKRGPIMLNNEPVYECRVHAFQDSAYFPLNDLNNIFKSYYRIAQEKNDRETMRRIRNKFTEIAVWRMYNVLKGRKGYRIKNEIRLFADEKFDLSAAFNAIKGKLIKKTPKAGN